MVSGEPPRRSSALPPGRSQPKAAPKCISGRTSYLRVRLAFHPYPQVIPPVCNLDGFGPPRACSARFTLPMGGSPGFGSAPRDWSPFRTRFRSGSGCACLSLATQTHSSAHSTKGTPSQDRSCSDRLEAHGFRFSFTPLAGVLFTIPSRYWFPIGRCRYLALGGGPPRFPPDSACRAVLTQRIHAMPMTVAYGALTRSGRPFQQRSADHRHPREGSTAPSNASVLPPSRQRRSARFAGTVWAPPRSLAATRGILSSPGGTEMFQFPPCPPLNPSGARPSRRAGCPIRKPLDRRLPAPPQGVAPRGRVLHRPSAPRHPPCAHLRKRRSPLRRAARASLPCGTKRRRAPAGGRAAPAAQEPVPGPLSGETGSGNPVSFICQGARRRVEPRGVEPRTSAVQRRRSPC